MDRTTEIIKRYEKSDSYERLCIFLSFPDLRDVFEDIELKIPVADEHRTFLEWLK